MTVEVAEDELYVIDAGGVGGVVVEVVEDVVDVVEEDVVVIIVAPAGAAIVPDGADQV